MNNEPDTDGGAVPPYEGRRETADIDPGDEGATDGANVGGATGPVADDRMKAPDPAETEGGATASPADEQPADQLSEGADGDDGVGSADIPGTPGSDGLGN